MLNVSKPSQQMSTSIRLMSHSKRSQRRRIPLPRGCRPSYLLRNEHVNQDIASDWILCDLWLDGARFYPYATAGKLYA